MDAERFSAMVRRLEQESAASPRTYQVKVALLALLGFLILALVLGVAGFGLVLLAAIGLLIAFQGGAAWLLLLKFGKLLVLMAIPLWFLVKSATRALFVRLPAPQGVEIQRAEAPALFAAIDSMRQRLRGPRVHHVLIVDEVNAAIVQRPLFGLIGWPRNYLLLGLPLLDSMAPDEALAVVAHEYGHLAGSHGRFGAFIYRLRLSWAMIGALADHWQGRIGRLLQRLVGWYAPYFNAYTFVLARANEYQADEASVDLVGAPAAAHALKRVNLAAPHYRRFLDTTFQRIGDQAAPPQDLLLRWADVSSQTSTVGEADRWLAEALDREHQLLDTHPTLRARLSAMPGQAGQLEALPPPRSAASAADTWLAPVLRRLRDQFQADWTQRVAEPWSKRHQEILAQRDRLATLHAMAERTAEEEFERLRLRVQLEPEHDALPDLVAYNLAHADHAPALYLEGCWRLDHDDESGLDLLERAMARDADAVGPGCERAHAYLSAKKDARAAAYAERWQQRQTLEQQRAQQLESLDVSHRLQAAALDADTLAAVRHCVQAAGIKNAKAMYLARRVLPADPALKTYVLAVELGWSARRRGLQHNIVNRLAQQTWPLHVVICTLDGKYSELSKPLRAIGDARLQ